MSRRRTMSRRSSAKVLGGIGSPSGVRKPTRRSAAFFSLGLKPRMPSRINAAFIRLTIRLCSPTLVLAVGPLGIFVLGCRDRHHLAVITLAAQPAEKRAFEQLGVEPIGLGAPVLARHRHTRCVNDVGLNVACTEPTRQPEAVTARLEGDSDAFDPMACLRRFLSPSMQQLQQCALVDRELLQRLALNARHDAGDEPVRQAQFNNGDQRAVRIEGARGSAQIVQLLHRALHRFTSATMDAISSPPPRSISLGGLRTPAPGVRRAAIMGPPSANLHNKGSDEPFAESPLYAA